LKTELLETLEIGPIPNIDCGPEYRVKLEPVPEYRGAAEPDALEQMARQPQGEGGDGPVEEEGDGLGQHAIQLLLCVEL